MQLSIRQDNLFTPAYEEAQKIENTYEKVTLLIELFRQKSELFQEIYQQVGSIEDKYFRAIALIELIPQDPKILQEVINLTDSLAKGDYALLTESEKGIRESNRAFIYSKIARYKPDLMKFAITNARSNFYKDRKAGIIANLAKYYDQSQFLDEAVTAIYEVAGSYLQSELMSSLRDCDRKYVEAALILARRIDDTYEQFCFFTTFKNNQYNSPVDLVELVDKIEDPYQKAISLIALQYPSSRSHEQILKMQEQIEDEHLKAHFMLEAASRLCSSDKRLVIVEKVLGIAARSDWEHNKSLIIQYLINHEFSKPYIGRMKKLSCEIEDITEKARAFAALAKYDNALVDTVYEIFDSNVYTPKSGVFLDSGYVSELNEDWRIYNKFLIIFSLVNIDEKAIVNAKEILEEIQNPAYKALGLCKLALYDCNLCSSALKSTPNIGGVFARADALADLAICCPDELLPDIMEAVDFLPISEYKAQVYGELIQDWSFENCSHQLFSELLHILSNRKRDNFFKDLRSLQSAIIYLGGDNAMNKIFIHIKRIVSQWP